MLSKMILIYNYKRKPLFLVVMMTCHAVMSILALKLIYRNVTFVYSNNERLEGVRKQAYYYCIKNNKIPRNKHNKPI